MREFALTIGKKNFFHLSARSSASNEEEARADTPGASLGDPDDLVGVDATPRFSPLFHPARAFSKGCSGRPPANLAGLYQHQEGRAAWRPQAGGAAAQHAWRGRPVLHCRSSTTTTSRTRFRFVAPCQSRPASTTSVSMGVGCLFAASGHPGALLRHRAGACTAPATATRTSARPCGASRGRPSTRATPFFLSRSGQSPRSAPSQPALRYGRQYFRPISGSGVEFGVSGGAPGMRFVFAGSSTIRSSSVLANTFTNSGFTGFAVVDFALNPDGFQFRLLHSNKGNSATPPGPCVTRAQGTVTIRNPDGSISNGPLRAVPFTLQPMEIQILGRNLAAQPPGVRFRYEGWHAPALSFPAFILDPAGRIVASGSGVPSRRRERFRKPASAASQVRAKKQQQTRGWRLRPSPAGQGRDRSDSVLRIDDRFGDDHGVCVGTAAASRRRCLYSQRVSTPGEGEAPALLQAHSSLCRTAEARDIIHSAARLQGFHPRSAADHTAVLPAAVRLTPCRAGETPAGPACRPAAR